MEFQVDIWLRGTTHATTVSIAPVERVPASWTQVEAAAVLVGMLRAIDRLKNPDDTVERVVSLRGFSWIVNPFDGGGVVIAIELSLGAAVAGPFDIEAAKLSTMIDRAIADDRAVAAMPASSTTVH